MPKNLKRYYGRGDLHFLTFSCYRRLPLLKTVRARNLFVKALGQVRERHMFKLAGYVVMPEHVHLLISEPPKVTLSVVLKALKQRVSRDLRKNNVYIRTRSCVCHSWGLTRVYHDSGSPDFMTSMFTVQKRKGRSWSICTRIL